MFSQGEARGRALQADFLVAVVIFEQKPGPDGPSRPGFHGASMQYRFDSLRGAQIPGKRYLRGDL